MKKDIEKIVGAIPKNNIKNFLSNYYPIIILVFVILLRIFSPISLVCINGDSMYPTFHDGQIEVMHKINNDELKTIKRLDVMVTTVEFRQLIKRVIGLPGDTVTVLSNGTVIVNDKELTELKQYQNTVTRNSDLLNDKSVLINIIVPDNHFFLLGDNFYNSYDSRFFGPISSSKVKGIVKEEK